MTQSVFVYCPNTTGRLQIPVDGPFVHWELNGNRAHEVDGMLSKQEPQKIVELANPQDDVELMAQLMKHVDVKYTNTNDWKLYRAPFARDQYYPRIFRPVYVESTKPFRLRSLVDHHRAPFDARIASDTAFQLNSLTSKLRKICHVVSPTNANLQVYGQEIRELLIVACTEFEAQCKGILLANGYTKKKMTTRDYIKIAPAMQLHEYTARVSPYADMRDREPFKNWHVDQPSQSLTWYHAYNLTKHNRETEFSAATLEQALDAVGACAIITFAQYGKLPAVEASTSEFLSIRKRPDWFKFACYTKKTLSQENWELLEYPFDVS